MPWKRPHDRQAFRLIDTVWTYVVCSSATLHKHPDTLICESECVRRTAQCAPLGAFPERCSVRRQVGGKGKQKRAKMMANNCVYETDFVLLERTDVKAQVSAGERAKLPRNAHTHRGQNESWLFVTDEQTHTFTHTTTRRRWNLKL